MLYVGFTVDIMFLEYNPWSQLDELPRTASFQPQIVKVFVFVFFFTTGLAASVFNNNF